jgi:acyl-CoA synthetase (AMP-forming)/AMP-acid ligase II
MSGYLNRAADTKKRLIDGWYDTGDVMRRDENGFVFFVGRADDMFQCGGENVYPGEVEKLLGHHPDVAQVCVVPVADEIKYQLPVAFVVPKPGSKPSADALRRFALDNGPAYAHPRAVWFVDELPLAGTNKIDRKTLLDHVERRRDLDRMIRDPDVAAGVSGNGAVVNSQCARLITTSAIPTAAIHGLPGIG